MRSIKTLLFIAIISIFSISTFAESITGSVKLLQKDPKTWDIIEEGNIGTLKYTKEGSIFEYKFTSNSMTKDETYTLINYVDPWPGNDSICLGENTVNSSGKLTISGSYDFDSFKDYKFWLVLSSDIDCESQKMVKWNPNEYLFEKRLISFTKIEELSEEEVVVEQETITAKSNTFNEDTRCNATKPIEPTWSLYSNDLLTWSAMGGDKVEIRFGYDPLDLKYSTIYLNDGHELVGIGTETGWWGGYWQMRTINNCAKSDWTPVLSGHGSW